VRGRRRLVGIAGLAAAAVGVLLFLDPFASLGVLIGTVAVGLVLLAVDELAAAGRCWMAWLTGAVWLEQRVTATYPDVRFGDVVRPGAGVQVREMAGRCLSEPKVFVSILQVLSFGRTVLARGGLPVAFTERLAENVPTGAIEASVLVAQGGADPLVLPAMQQEFVASRCADGQPVDYRAYEGRDHMGVVADDSPLVADLLAWTRDRLDGLPAASTCP